MPLTVLHLCTELSVGGAENHLVMLLRGLAQDGRYKPHIAAFRDAVGDMRSLRPDFEAMGIPVHILGQIKGHDPGGFVGLARLLRQVRPEILHTHLFRGDVFGTLVGAMVGVPARVATVHNIEARFKQRLLQPVFRLAYGLDHRIIAISDSVAVALQRHLNLPARKIRRIYYGFDAEERWRGEATADLRPEFGFSREDFVLGTIGRIGEQKGHEFLIQALGEVRQRLPRTKLVIVGVAESDGTIERLRSMVHAMDLERHVVFAGYRDDIASVLDSLDVFVLPSLWEGFGLVLLEAMSRGKPVVASKVDAIPEIIEDDRQGLLVAPGDVPALAGAIVKLGQSPETCRRMSAEGPPRVEQFSAGAMVAETIELYASLLQSQQPPGSTEDG